eukprot:gene540-1951_t
MESTALFKTSHAKFADEFKAFCAKFPEDAQNTMQLFYESVKHNNVSRISFVYERDAAGNHVLLDMRSTMDLPDMTYSGRNITDALLPEVLSQLPEGPALVHLCSNRLDIPGMRALVLNMKQHDWLSCCVWNSMPYFEPCLASTDDSSRPSSPNERDHVTSSLASITSWNGKMTCVRKGWLG